MPAPSRMLDVEKSRPFFAPVQSLRGLGAMAVAAYHISGWRLHGEQLLPHVAWRRTLLNATGDHVA